MRRRWPSFVLFVILGSSVSEGQDFWIQSPSPQGGTVLSVIEAANGDLLAGTVEGTFRSTDGGGNWVLSEIGMVNGYTTDLFRHSDGTLLACGFDRAAGESRLYRSRDHGLTWTEIPGVPGWLDPASNPRQWAVSNSSGHLFTAGSRVSGDYVVIRSTNDGASWTLVRTISIFSFNVITDLAINSRDTLFLGVGLGGSLQGLYRSGDNGTTWTRVFNTSVDAIFVNSNDEVYIISGQKVHRSTNHGTMWSEIYGATSLPSAWDIPLSLMVRETGDVFIGTGGTNAGGVGIARSLDGGTTWSLMQDGLPTSAHSLFSHPRIQSLSTHSSNTLLCGIDEIFVRFGGSGSVAGLYTSTDNGSTWNESNAGLRAARMRRVRVLQNGHLLATPLGVGLLYSSDGGVTWVDRSPLVSGRPHMIEAMGQSPSDGVVYAGGQGRVFRTEDLGLTWSDISGGQFVLAINSIDVNAAGVVFVAHEGGTTSGFFRSTNNGANWTRVWQGGTGDKIYVAPNGSVFGIGSRKVYRSDDDGTNWSELTNGIGSGVGHLTFTADNLIFASLSGSGDAVIRRSSDNGGSWVSAESGIPRGSNGNFGATVFALKANSTGGIFAFAKYKDVQDADHYDMFRSTDNGTTWHVRSSGIVGPYTEVNDISVDRSSGATYLAATNGIYRSSDEPNGVVSNPGATPKMFHLEPNYPNPFNPKTMISFVLTERSQIRLVVYDILGREVRTLVDGTRQAGTHHVQFDGSALPSAVYLYKLEVNGSVEMRKMIMAK